MPVEIQVKEGTGGKHELLLSFERPISIDVKNSMHFNLKTLLWRVYAIETNALMHKALRTWNACCVLFIEGKKSEFGIY